MSASREAQLKAFADLVAKWNSAINLVAPGTIADFGERHIADSLQLAALAPPDDAPWIDIGSGGGLPGIVIAIAHPDRSVTLVDSDHRKVAFLRTAIRELGLRQCTATQSRIESLPAANARHLSARALAPLDRLMPYLARHVAAGGTAWLMKGRGWRSELDQASPIDDYVLTVHPSQTDPQAAILQFDRKTIG